MRYATIMAGGTGTRLWPMSRKRLPKQLIPFIYPENIRPGQVARPQSLLEIAAGRLRNIVEPQRQTICTGERYRTIIEHTLPHFAGGPDQGYILGEPEGRDTINAVGFAAAVFGRNDPDAVFAVLTADHLIEPDEVFVQAMETGFALVEDDPSRLITFAITPTHPATGYGYVRRGDPIEGFEQFPCRACQAREFKEKPDLETATAYIYSGDYGWNSGMFIFHARTYMTLLKTYAPASYEGLCRIADAWDTPDRQRVLDEVYPTLPKTSVDYGIMEPASRDESVSICCVDMDVKWLDVGSWPSFAQTIVADPLGNRIAGDAQVELLDSSRNLVFSGHTKVQDDSELQPSRPHTIALIGCHDMMVIHTDDATLIMPANRDQDVKTLYNTLPDEVR